VDPRTRPSASPASTTQLPEVAPVISSDLHDVDARADEGGERAREAAIVTFTTTSPIFIGTSQLEPVPDRRPRSSSSSAGGRRPRRRAPGRYEPVVAQQVATRSRRTGSASAACRQVLEDVDEDGDDEERSPVSTSSAKARTTIG
jgi:hypothetical protein